MSNREDGIIITIGNENTDDFMKDCSLITATYHIDGRLVGKLGVIGPTRMKYNHITSVIEYLSENLSNSFKLTGGKIQMTNQKTHDEHQRAINRNKNQNKQNQREQTRLMQN
jgi:hypothetical protein